MILSYWTEDGIEKDAILQSLIQQLREGGYPTLHDSGWKPWDLAIDEHLWSRIPIEVVVENHGESKRLARFRISWHLAPVAKAILWTCGVFLILGMLGVCAMAGRRGRYRRSGRLLVGDAQEWVGHPRDEQNDQRCRSQSELLPINGTHKQA